MANLVVRRLVLRHRKLAFESGVFLGFQGGASGVICGSAYSPLLSRKIFNLFLQDGLINLTNTFCISI